MHVDQITICLAWKRTRNGQARNNHKISQCSGNLPIHQLPTTQYPLSAFTGVFFLVSLLSVMVEMQVEADFPPVSEICNTEVEPRIIAKKWNRRFRELPIRR